MPGSYLQPIPQADGYASLRMLATHEVFLGEYGLGFHLLGRAVLTTPFVRKDTFEKKQCLRSFSRVVRADFARREERLQESELEFQHQAAARARQGRAPKCLLDVVFEECRIDARCCKQTRAAVDEMGRFVASVCKAPQPAFSPTLFAELEDLFQ